MSILETKGLCKSYGSNNILSDVDLRIDNGEFIAIMGQSGCGKSTLLYCISGMDKSSAGKICFDSVDMADLTNKQMQELRLKEWDLFFKRQVFLRIFLLLITLFIRRFN